MSFKNFSIILIVSFLSISAYGGGVSNPSSFIFLQTLLTEVLAFFTALTGGLGGAVICMTVFFKLLLSPLSLFSMRASKKIKELEPIMDEIKEKSKNDPVAQQQEISKLFREKKVNPFISFGVPLISIPLVWSLFNLFQDSSKVFGSSFLSWIPDLSKSDPYFILPTLSVLVFALTFLRKNEELEKIPKSFRFLLVGLFATFMFKMPAAVLLYSISSTTFSVLEKAIFHKLIG